jgi:hypothetical protein
MNKLVRLYSQDQTDAARELFAFKTFHGKYLRFHTPPSSPKDGSGCSTEGAENGARYEGDMGYLCSSSSCACTQPRSFGQNHRRPFD